MKTKKTILIIINTLFIFSFTFADPITEINKDNLPYLKYGLTNDFVKSLQEFLNEAGYNSTEEGDGSPGKETKFFGESTKNSIMILQKYYSLPVTGSIDQKTADAINKAINDDNATNDQISAEKNPFLQGTTNDEPQVDISDVYQNFAVTSSPAKIPDFKKIFSAKINQPENKLANPSNTFFADFLEKTINKNQTPPSPNTTYQSFFKKIIYSIFSN